MECLARRAPFLWTAWGKLYPMGLVRETPFREEVLYSEDLLFFYQLLQRVERVSYIPDRLYHYTCRMGSLVNSGVNEKRCAVLPVLDGICAGAPARFSPKAVRCWELVALDTGARLAMQAVEGGADGPVEEYLKRFQGNIRRHFSWRALFCCREKKTAAAVLALRAHIGIFRAAACLYGRIKPPKAGTE